MQYWVGWKSALHSRDALASHTLHSTRPFGVWVWYVRVCVVCVYVWVHNVCVCVRACLFAWVCVCGVCSHVQSVFAPRLWMAQLSVWIISSVYAFCCLMHCYFCPYWLYSIPQMDSFAIFSLYPSPSPTWLPSFIKAVKIKLRRLIFKTYFIISVFTILPIQVRTLCVVCWECSCFKQRFLGCSLM